jgi:glutaredoxin
VEAKQRLYVFHRHDCPHCKAEISYLESMKDTYKNVEFIYYEVLQNPANLKHLEHVKKTLKDENNYVPYTVIGKYSFVGFNENTKLSIQKHLDYCIQNNCEDVVAKVIQEKRPISLEEFINLPKEESIQPSHEFVLPLLGKVNAKELSLPILSIVIGFLDGFNPCAMWVLLFLISMLLGMKNKKRMWLLGITFLLTSAMIYTFFLVSWLKVSLSFKNILFLRFIIALIALGTGYFHLKSYRKMRHIPVGCIASDTKKRNKIMESIRKTTKEKNLFLSMIGVIALAISVNFMELTCSAGLPLVYTQILSLNELSTLSYLFNLFLYIFFYLIDDLVLFSIAMFTLKVTGITNKYNKYSHLLGGILLLSIGILLLLKPELLLFAI